MELMHPTLKASTENGCRSAFVQFLATTSENKECYLSIAPDRRVRDSDRLRSRAMVHSLANQKVWYRIDAEEKGPQHSSQAHRS